MWIPIRMPENGRHQLAEGRLNPKFLGWKIIPVFLSQRLLLGFRVTLMRNLLLGKSLLRNERHQILRMQIFFKLIMGLHTLCAKLSKILNYLNSSGCEFIELINLWNIHRTNVPFFRKLHEFFFTNWFLIFTTEKKWNLRFLSFCFISILITNRV